MAVDLRFFDATTGEEISLDKAVGGHDFGVCKKNTPYVYPVVVKNLGATDGNGLSIKASPLNILSEVTNSEYDAQVLAASWKTFSLLPDEGFNTTLSIPNIPAGTTLIGKKKFVDNFTNPQTSNWSTRANTNILWKWTGSSLTCEGENKTGAFYGRVDAQGWGSQKDFDVVYMFNPPANATTGSAFTMFGFRMNAIGDEKGYLINLKRTFNTTTGVNTGFFEIRKGAGIKNAGTLDFGTTLFTSQSFTWTDFMPIRFKVFTNSGNLPEIIIWVGNIADTDTPVGWGATNPVFSWVDTANTFNGTGGASIVFGASAAMATGVFELRESKLYAQDTEGKVYIKTTVGEGATDQQIYKSALELSYD